jgi:hypothetical protein
MSTPNTHTEEQDDFGWHPDASLRYVKTFESFISDSISENELLESIIEDLNLNEGLMSELDILAQEARNLADFKKAAKKAYPDLNSMEGTDEWLEEIYKQSK